MPEAAVYRVEELAEVLSVGRRQLYEQIREGRIPGVVRIGRSIRISRHAVDTWLHGAQLMGGAPPTNEATHGGPLQPNELEKPHGKRRSASRPVRA